MRSTCGRNSKPVGESDLSARRHLRTISNIGRLRKEARDEIDLLIRFLDETEGHMELEPDGTEAEDSDPAEDGGDEEDDGISEPALGSIEDHPNGYLDASDWNGRGRCPEIGQVAIATTSKATTRRRRARGGQRAVSRRI